MTTILDRLFSIGPVRKTIWRLWYPFLTRRIRSEGVLFLNYAFETEPSARIPKLGSVFELIIVRW